MPTSLQGEHPPTASGCCAARAAAPAMSVLAKVACSGRTMGDPRTLRSLKAARLISAAEVVIHDGLVSGGARAIPARRPANQRRQTQIAPFLPPGGDRPAAGGPARDGRGGAAQGRRVLLHLYRGGEELEACVAPPASPARSCPGSPPPWPPPSAPLTHRGAAQAVSFVTAIRSRRAPRPRLGGARPTQIHTVVIYMGLTVAGPIAGRLIAAGRAPTTWPAARSPRAYRTSVEVTNFTLARSPPAP